MEKEAVPDDDTTCDTFDTLLSTVTSHVLTRHKTLGILPVTPGAEAVRRTVAALPTHLPEQGKGTGPTLQYLQDDILTGCLTAQNGPRYFGFVTGGVTEAAQLADILGSSYDENVQVTLPDTSAATAIESRTLEMVLDLINIPRDTFQGRTIATGATSANILGLACARDHLYSVSPHLPKGYSYAQSGPPSAPGLPSPPIALLALHPHFSILKAAALVGIGAGPNVVHSLAACPDDELAVDLQDLERQLAEHNEVGRGIIVSYGLGEVNTGGFGRDLPKVAELCKQYGAWLHVDAAFGGFAAVVPELRHLVQGMDSANSLTLDGHKWLNVPYDCGLFFTRSVESLTSVLGPPASNTPAYLTPSGSSTTAAVPGQVAHHLVPSPLYVNIENSRRFRALPLFASLVSLGKQGYIDIISRNVQFAREVAQFIDEHPSYTLLNRSDNASAIVPLNIVLFSGSEGSKYPPGEEGASARLTKDINSSREMYVTGTKWRGVGAVRLAVSNWRTGRDGQDLAIVKNVLNRIAL